MSGIVYVVHCVDTEGPLYEASNVFFEQVKNIYGINIKATDENIQKIQDEELELSGNEKAIKNLFNSHINATKGSWNEIKEMLKKVTSQVFRNEFLDSTGNGWIYNWFCMDHVGFTGQNPRKRAAGHHVIYDFYHDMICKQNAGDIIQFHHHPVSISGNYNDSGTAIWGGA